MTPGQTAPYVGQPVQIIKSGERGYVSRVQVIVGQPQQYVEITTHAGDRIWPLSTLDFTVLQ
jgi:hypothetical protein